MLYRYYNYGEALSSGGLGLKRFVRWLAQLRGFLGRSSDEPAGAKTSWRGMRRLRDLMAMPIDPPSAAVQRQ